MNTQPPSVSMQGHGNVVGDRNVVTVTINGREEPRLFVNVPPKPRLLVGRDALLADLKARLMEGGGGTAAISAVRGLPGVGKTTLAAALAHDGDVLAHFGGGIFWGGLGPDAKTAGAADTVLRVWADPLGVDVTAYPDPHTLASAVGTALARRGKPVLLVLDDAWAWEPLAVLCEVDAPGSARLLTTRQPPLARAFAGDASAVADVEELPVEESLNLLRKLAPNAVALEPDAARELATLTGGLPLALTLVGCALATEGGGGHPHRVREVMARMKRAGARLTHLPIGAERTLHAAIAASDQWVNDPRWYVLGAFAPKPADFDEDAALAVLGMENGAALLYRLCDLGLVENAGERYSLHQTVADYARMQPEERLTDGDGRPTTAVERHASYYLDVANADRKDWRRIEAAWPQIQHAWRWVNAGADVDLLLEYVGAFHYYQTARGLWRAFIVWIERGLEIVKTANRREDEGTLLNNLAWVYDALGDKRRALGTYEEALAIRREVGDRSGEGTTLNNIAAVYRALGDPRRALGTYEEALAISREVGDRSGEGTTLNNIGGVYDALGDKRRALRTYEDALAIRREVGDRSGEGVTLHNMAMIYLNDGDYAQAQKYLEQALVIAEAVEYPALADAARNGLARVAAADNEFKNE